MDIGPFFAAFRIAHIMKQINTFPGSIPGISDSISGCGTLVEANVGPIRSLYVICHSQNVYGKLPV